MRIGIDARYLSHGIVGGVHKYVELLVPALIQAAREDELYLYADTKQPLEVDVQSLPKNVIVRYLKYHNPVSTTYWDVFMQREMARDRIDVAHFPTNYGFGPGSSRTIVTLHDAITILPLPKVLKREMVRKPRVAAMTAYLFAFSRAMLRRADLLVTVSEWSRREIIKACSFPPERIIAMTHGPAPNVRRIEDPKVREDVRRRYNLTKPFVIGDALKNPGTLVRAWPQLPEDLRSRYEIVFFSRTPDVPAPVLQAQSAGFARLLVRPPSADLIALYSMSEALVFPSWIEGLGLPLLEAMNCGAPVIASDRGAIPEVVGDAALLADAEDDAAFAQHMEFVFRSPAEAERLRALGFARAANFTWPNIARRLLDVYRFATHLPRNSTLHYADSK